jgi:predicted cation transporter
MLGVGAMLPPQPVIPIALGLFSILALVLILPFRVKRIERNLEPFFLIMGVAAVTISGLWSPDLVQEALKAPVVTQNVPIGIFQVVLVVGLAIHYFHRGFYRGVSSLSAKFGPKVFIFLLITLLGFLSSIISVIAASVILAEIAAACPYERKKKIDLIVITCFAVGLGAALTPLGEPLSTIAIYKLSGAPYNADFFFLIRLVGIYIAAGIVALAVLGAFLVGGRGSFGRDAGRLQEESGYSEKLSGVIMRAVKVYLFVAALILLGEGLSPLINWYFTQIPGYGLYWVNMISAAVDNATLTAAEIGPALSIIQIKSALLSLLISGGMLIPGNIPNIVAAGRLKITSGEWARRGVVLGLVILVLCFVTLLPAFL